jgi:hypothetical protein
MPSDLFSQRGAHVTLMRHDAHTPQVQTISIPAGGNGRIIVTFGIGVPDARVMKEIEVLIGQIKKLSAQRPRQLRTARAMLWIVAIIFPSAIVKERK